MSISLRGIELNWKIDWKYSFFFRKKPRISRTPTTTPLATQWCCLHNYHSKLEGGFNFQARSIDHGYHHRRTRTRATTTTSQTKNQTQTSVFSTTPQQHQQRQQQPLLFLVLLHSLRFPLHSHLCIHLFPFSPWPQSLVPHSPHFPPPPLLQRPHHQGPDAPQRSPHPSIHLSRGFNIVRKRSHCAWPGSQLILLPPTRQISRRQGSARDRRWPPRTRLLRQVRGGVRGGGRRGSGAVSVRVQWDSREGYLLGVWSDGGNRSNTVRGDSSAYVEEKSEKARWFGSTRDGKSVGGSHRFDGACTCSLSSARFRVGVECWFCFSESWVGEERDAYRCGVVWGFSPLGAGGACGEGSGVGGFFCVC